MSGDISLIDDVRVDELWVPIDGYENYAVSNYGRVMNTKRWRDLTPSPDGGGYMRVALYQNGVRKDIGVHRLVAKAFFVDFNEDIEVFHINDNREDNAILNLSLGARLRIKVRIVETGQMFSSLLACSDFLGVSVSAVSNAINEKERHQSVQGYTFEVIDAK